MSTLSGEWTINWAAFGARFGAHNIEQLVSTIPPSVPGLPVASPIDDFSATVDGLKKTCQPYLRIVPFGHPQDVISAVVENGDIMVFVRPAFDRDNMAEMLKQRGWHAEICFKNDSGQAFRKAPWGNTPQEVPCNSGQPDWIMHIFRLELPAVDGDLVRALKQQVRCWKNIFHDYDFPEDGNSATGGHWYLDPADFGTVAELENIAKELVSRPEGVKPKLSPVTCVQWAYQVLCLALNVPLSRSNMSRLGIDAEFAKHWQPKVGWAGDSLTGINALPFVPYTPAQVLQTFLDTYFQGQSLLPLLAKPGERQLLQSLLEAQKHPGLPELVAGYLDSITASGDISTPLQMGPTNFRFVMPIAFFCEARRPPANPQLPWFRYIGTALPDSVVTKA